MKGTQLHYMGLEKAKCLRQCLLATDTNEKNKEMALEETITHIHLEQALGQLHCK